MYLTQRWDDNHDAVVRWVLEHPTRFIPKGFKVESVDVEVSLIAMKQSFDYPAERWVVGSSDPAAYVDVLLRWGNAEVTRYSVVECKGWRCEGGKVIRQVKRYAQLLWVGRKLWAKKGCEIHKYVASPDNSSVDLLGVAGVEFVRVPAKVLPWTRAQTAPPGEDALEISVQ